MMLLDTGGGGGAGERRKNTNSHQAEDPSAAALRIYTDHSSSGIAYYGEQKPNMVAHENRHPQRHQHIIQLLLLHRALIKRERFVELFAAV